MHSELHGDDINAVTECVTDYINVCVDNTIPIRTGRFFPSNKPQITSDLKELLNKKRLSDRKGSKTVLGDLVGKQTRRLGGGMRKRRSMYRERG